MVGVSTNMKVNVGVFKRGCLEVTVVSLDDVRRATRGQYINIPNGDLYVEVENYIGRDYGDETVNVKRITEQFRRATELAGFKNTSVFENPGKVMTLEECKAYIKKFSLKLRKQYDEYIEMRIDSDADYYEMEDAQYEHKPLRKWEDYAEYYCEGYSILGLDLG